MEEYMELSLGVLTFQGGTHALDACMLEKLALIFHIAP